MAGHEYRTVHATLQKNKGKWVVSGRVYNPNTGKTEQRMKSTGFRIKDNTVRKAEAVMREIVEAWEAEANAEPITRDPLFSEYISKWLLTAEATKRQNTALSYRQYADKHIIPALGGCRVREITRQQLQDFCNDKLKAGLSVNSVKKFFVVINGALRDAVIDGIIPANPGGNNIRYPQAKKFEGKAYEPEQVAKLLDAAEAEGEPFHSGIVLAVIYGLRRSEICGLRWKDIDFDAGCLEVRNTVTQNGHLKIDSEQTKTRTSRRTIDLIQSTIPFLRGLKATQERSGLTLDKVCRWPDGAEVRPDYLTRRTGQIMKRCGLEKIRLHDLRHTAATLLAREASPKQVQSFLGHSDLDMTLGLYAHLLEPDRQATAGIMDGILKKSVFCYAKRYADDNETDNAERESA
jgi:integrase